MLDRFAGRDCRLESDRTGEVNGAAPRLPHLGTATVETHARMGMVALDNLDAHFADRPLLTPVLA